MKLIGITGPTGAGKSSLTEVAGALGFQVIDCDKTARKAVEKGTEGLKEVVKAFGSDILLEDGSLNRKALAKKAFATEENTRLLNKVLLPFITELLKEECKGEYVLLDAPTLFESGMNEKCSAVVGVLADESTRLSRIMARDNISREEAALRMNAGKPDEFYKKNCDYLICNNGDITEFQREFTDILKEIKER